MRKIREVCRLRFEQKFSYAKIAKSVSVGETTVREYVERAKKADLSWPLPYDMDDLSLEKLLYRQKEQTSSSRQIPDFPHIHRELKRKGMTLQLLWEEYQQTYPSGYGYSRFCDLYREWACKREVWMPQQHKAGEKVFIDYAGLTVPIFDEKKGEYFNAQIFVSTLGASNYTYVEASKTQKLEDWIISHRRMFTFYGGVPEVLVPDNLKSGVTSPHLYEPDCNPTYLEMAQHYGVAVIPARVRKPQDKGKVEQAVLDVERQILARIRNQKFFSLQELNQTIWQLLKDFNNRPFQKIPGCRFSHFMEIDKPVLKPLPATSYEFAYWEKQTVGHNYHIDVQHHYYSVPYAHVKQIVEIRFNERIVEIFRKGKLIALHQRSFNPGKYTTNHSHRPIAHQHQADCTSEKMLQWAQQIGPHVMQWIQRVLTDDSLHIRQREKRCLGVLRLSKSYELERLDSACKRGLFFQAFTFKSIESMLKNNLDRQPIPEKAEKLTLPQQHGNIRGADYYDQLNQGETIC